MAGKQAAHGEVMVDVERGALEAASRHVAGRPGQIRAKIQQTLTRARVEVAHDEIERGNRPSYVGEVAWLTVVARVVAVRQREDGLPERTVRP